MRLFERILDAIIESWVCDLFILLLFILMIFLLGVCMIGLFNGLINGFEPNTVRIVQ